MTNLVFLEAATQSKEAIVIIDSNKALIDFATAKVDHLVKSKVRNPGRFIDITLEDTSLCISSSVSSVIIEASSVFSSIIALGYSDTEKKELIEAYSYAIGCDDSELKVIMCFGAGSMALSMAGGMVGSKVGHAVGNVTGALASRLSSAHRNWKKLIKETNRIQEQLKGKTNPALKKRLIKLEQEKTKAHIQYLEVKKKSQSIAATAVGTAGGMAGSIGARVVGAAHGIV